MVNGEIEASSGSNYQLFRKLLKEADENDDTVSLAVLIISGS